MPVGVVLGPESIASASESGVVLDFEYDNESYQVLITNTELDMLSVKAMMGNYSGLIKGGGLTEHIRLSDEGEAVLNVEQISRTSSNMNEADEVNMVTSLYTKAGDPNEINKVFVFQEAGGGWNIESTVDTDLGLMGAVALDQFERVTQEAIGRARENDARLHARIRQHVESLSKE